MSCWVVGSLIKRGGLFSRAKWFRLERELCRFTKLVTCKTCGCSCTAEVQKGKSKKGRYVYYRCPSERGKCDAPYIREKRFAELLGETVRQLQLDEECLNWLRDALTERQGDRRRFTQERTMRLQSRYQTIQNALDSAYEDRV